MFGMMNASQGLPYAIPADGLFYSMKIKKLIRE